MPPKKNYAVKKAADPKAAPANPVKKEDKKKEKKDKKDKPKKKKEKKDKTGEDWNTTHLNGKQKSWLLRWWVLLVIVSLLK